MMVSTAEYLEQRARPAHTPVPSHQPQAARPSERQRGNQANGSAEQGGEQRTVGQHPGAGC